MIERQIQNILREYKIRKNVVTIVTQVLVDKNDEAFIDPTKPVGRFYLKEEAELLSKIRWIYFQRRFKKTRMEKSCSFT